MRLLLLAAVLLVPPVASSQIPLRSTTLVDVLSADPNYSSLLRLLQRARLIPTLNKLNGSTLFAPTNDAVNHHVQVNDLWRSALHNEDQFLTDNVQEQLRQQLFYHLLNQSLSALPNDEDLQTYMTLHYPRASIEKPSPNPPPNPPWMPIPGGTLGGEPQRLRVSARDQKAWAGVDAFGKGGGKILNRTEAGNGVVYGLSKVLETPPDLGLLLIVL